MGQKLFDIYRTILGTSFRLSNGQVRGMHDVPRETTEADLREWSIHFMKGDVYMIRRGCDKIRKNMIDGSRSGKRNLFFIPVRSIIQSETGKLWSQWTGRRRSTRKKCRDQKGEGEWNNLG